MKIKRYSGELKVLVSLFPFYFVLLTAPYGFAWTTGGFKTPESVLKDPAASFYYVSNINGSPTGKDDNGFISKIGLNGKVVDLKFIDGKTREYTLNAPKGLAIDEGILYVADIDFVRAFDLKSGENIANINLAHLGAQFLNDITLDDEGNLYVSDTATNTIYQIEPARGYKVSVYLRSKALQGPNGVTIHSETKALLVASWSGGKILSIFEGKVEEVPLTRGFRNLDGIDYDKEGNIYFSDYTQGTIYRLNKEGKVDKIADGLNQPADISVDRENSLLLIPEFAANRVKAIPIKDKTSDKKLILPQKELKDAFDSLEIQLIDPPCPMVDFTLRNLEGEKINTKDLRGKFLWVNFWATRCPPCRAEMPSMEKVWKRFGGENFVLLAVDLREDERRVRSFINDNGYTFPVLLDTTGEVGSVYKVRAIPTSFFINQEGEIVGVAIGTREWTNEKFYNFLRKLSKTR